MLARAPCRLMGSMDSFRSREKELVNTFVAFKQRAEEAEDRWAVAYGQRHDYRIRRICRAMIDMLADRAGELLHDHILSAGCLAMPHFNMADRIEMLSLG